MTRPAPLGQGGAAEDGVLAVSVNYPGLGRDVPAGTTVLVDSGLIRLEVVSASPARVRCRVVVPARLGHRRHINLPGVKVRLPALTDKDRADLTVGVEEQVDYFALSFVREADDIDILRRFLSGMGSTAHVIAKIEDQSAIANLDEIVLAADAVMVARGDLGIEVPMEELPLNPETRRRHLHPPAQAGHRRHAPAGIDDHVPGAHPRRGERHRLGRLGPRPTPSCCRARRRPAVTPLECVQFMKRVAGRIEGSATKGYNTALPLKSHKDRCSAPPSCSRRRSRRRHRGLHAQRPAAANPGRPARLALPHLCVHGQPAGLPAPAAHVGAWNLFW